MTTPAEQKVEIPPGLVAVTTYGSITPETAQSLVDMQKHHHNVGLNNITVTFVPGGLVDKARNEAVRLMLGNPALRYLLFIDADMAFAPDIVQKLILTAFHPQFCPWADAVGAYCNLRGKPYLPTIDTGSGQWESHDALCGPIEVIRTGAACILVKRHVFERMAAPWYGVRPAPRPLDVLAELDNYARCKLDGRNLLREHPSWDILEKCAREDAASQRRDPNAQSAGGFLSSVGEDSNFADKMKALGFRIIVQTDAVCQHVERRPIGPGDHIAAMKETEKLTRLAVGVLV